MASQTPFTDEIATRFNTLGFSFDGMLLPNPDPILRAQGKSIQTYRQMWADPLVGSAIRRRKSAVRALDSGLDRGAAPARVFKAVQELLARLPLDQIIGQILDATLYGYQPIEVLWEEQRAMLMPKALLGKPAEWFSFDTDNRLRYMSLTNPMGALLPERKFLLPRQDNSYDNPYGQADLSMCFWPLIFKKGGMKFWLNFSEKYGGQFAVGKLPPNASDEDQNKLLTALEDMIQNAVAVIPTDGSIAFPEVTGKSASADLYERLVMHCRGEITIALLGQNQTTEASANLASATAGLSVTVDMRDAHAKLVAATINQLIGWFCEVNFDGAAPTWSMWDQASQDKLQADRDKSNFTAGARFTNRYWMRAYGYQEGDLVAPAVPGGAVAPAVAFAEGTQPTDPVAGDVATLSAAAAPAWADMTATLQDFVTDATSLDQLQQQVLAAFGGLDSDQLVKLMSAALALAHLKGLDAARTENGG